MPSTASPNTELEGRLNRGEKENGAASSHMLEIIIMITFLKEHLRRSTVLPSFHGHVIENTLNRKQNLSERSQKRDIGFCAYKLNKGGINYS